MLLLLKTNHTHVGREPNCNLKFVKKKSCLHFKSLKFKRLAFQLGPETVDQSTKEDKNKKITTNQIKKSHKQIERRKRGEKEKSQRLTCGGCR